MERNDERRNRRGRIKRLFMGIMEGYKDTCITPLTDFSTTNEMVGCSSLNYGRSQRKEGPINENESMNIQKGREGRRKMAEMYSVLQSLVPTLSHVHKVIFPSSAFQFSNWVSFSSSVYRNLFFFVCENS